MLDLLEEIEDKWADVIESSDDWTEKTLAEEFLDDLRLLREHLNG